MTGRITSRGARTRAELLDAAMAFAMLDHAVDQLRAAAAWSAKQLDHCENHNAEDVTAVLACWANSNASFVQALALLEHADRLLVAPTRPVGIEITRPGRMNQPGNEETA